MEERKDDHILFGTTGMRSDEEVLPRLFFRFHAGDYMDVTKSSSQGGLFAENTQAPSFITETYLESVPREACQCVLSPDASQVAVLLMDELRIEPCTKLSRSVNILFAQLPAELMSKPARRLLIWLQNHVVAVVDGLGESLHFFSATTTAPLARLEVQDLVHSRSNSPSPVVALLPLSLPSGGHIKSGLLVVHEDGRYEQLWLSDTDDKLVLEAKESGNIPDSSGLAIESVHHVHLDEHTHGLFFASSSQRYKQAWSDSRPSSSTSVQISCCTFQITTDTNAVANWRSHGRTLVDRYHQYTKSDSDGPNIGQIATNAVSSFLKYLPGTSSHGFSEMPAYHYFAVKSIVVSPDQT